jgi:hypothetical protein
MATHIWCKRFNLSEISLPDDRSAENIVFMNTKVIKFQYRLLISVKSAELLPLPFQQQRLLHQSIRLFGRPGL